MIMDQTTKMTETGAPSKKAAAAPALPDYTELREDFEEFLTLTQDARSLSEKCRDYYDGKQYTEEQIKELKRRKQAPVVNNRIKPKQNGLLGLFSLRKGDPKAYPRNTNNFDEGSAQAVTDALNYCTDATQYGLVRGELADNFFCEGYAGALVVEEEAPDGSVNVVVEHVPWDRIFFDPHSRKSDFSDARYKGYVLWMDEDEILEAFPDAADILEHNVQLSTDTTFEDKPIWFQSGRRRRHLVATHYFKRRGKHYAAIYTGAGFLLEPTESPYVDEFGRPECPLLLQHAYITREGDRQGELASYLDIQDEINRRRSKGMFFISQRQTFGNRGAVSDVKALKRELAKPDGHIELDQGEFGKDFGILPTNDMAQGQFEMLVEAKAEIDAQGYNAQLAGERQKGDLSGKAIGKLQNAGIVDLTKLYDGLAALELRIYRHIWHRIRQFWTEEKWVRVTDDQDSLRFVGFNVPITMKEQLQEIMDDQKKPKAMRVGASAQMILLEQQNPAALEEIVMVKNPPAELDMDIILDQSFDYINASQEQLDMILTYGLQGQFDLIDLLQISSIRGKDKLIEKLESRRAEAAKAAEESGPDPQAAYLMSKAAEAEANVEVKRQDAQQTAIENQLLQQNQVVPFKGTVSA